VVGTRKATEYGKRVTSELVKDSMGQGVTFVSGLAYGIDIALHLACIKAKINTVAVLAGGFNWIYPNAHQKYVDDIIESGGILSEYPLRQKPDARFFPLRNRIIAGMSDATLVVEAAERGGALITADYANNYNREVFAVPGNLDKLFSEANKAVPIINKIQGLTDIKVEQVTGMPQMVVKYNRNKIAQYGLNIAEVNRILNTAYAGGTTGVVYEGERKFDLVVRIPKNGNTDIDALKSLLIPTPKGNQIPLNEIAEITFKTAPSQISRENAQRRIVIEANVRGRDVESVVLEIQQKLEAKLKLPEGYYITYGGQFQNLQEAKERLQLAAESRHHRPQLHRG